MKTFILRKNELTSFYQDYCALKYIQFIFTYYFSLYLLLKLVTDVSFKDRY